MVGGSVRRVAPGWYGDSMSILPLWTLWAEYSLSPGLAVGFEGPVLPGLLVRLDDHRFTGTFFPFYMASGGSTVIALSYGYRFRL